MNANVTYEWVKKIHMYAGLLTFTALFVWGVTGVHAVFLPPPGEYMPPEVSSVREVPYNAAGDLDDQQLGRKIFEAIEVPLAGGHYNVHRDDELNLGAVDVIWNLDDLSCCRSPGQWQWYRDWFGACPQQGGPGYRSPRGSRTL